jgi:anhydro-N-acetylmuramic acid kinase
MTPSRIIVGAMSGTSADGVDVAVVRIWGTGHDVTAELVAHHHRAYPECVRQAIFEIRSSPKVSLRGLMEVGRQITVIYADAVNESLGQLDQSDVACIGAHGQTLFHAPPDTLQWLDPALLAARTGIPVVSDFRRADCAAGGQGAPLVPMADYVLLRHAGISRVLLNLGGIANLTYLPAAGKLSGVIACDTGPGNCVSDWLMRTLDPASGGIDRDGVRALAGSPIASIVTRVMADGFFAKSPPKSTDAPDMIELFKQAAGRLESHSQNDLLATACRLTGVAVADAIRRFVPGPVDEALVSGGGVKNPAMMKELRRSLGSVVVNETNVAGVDANAKEAVAFAILAALTLDNVPGNVPSATGAGQAVVLGSITPRPYDVRR